MWQQVNLYNNDMQIQRNIDHILRKINESGFEVAIVGGAVREILTGKKISGWDLTTNATPAQILKMFPGSHYTNRFGTVLVKVKNGEIVEVTTYRTESGYSDARHPDEVKWGKTLEEDLARRDFTINAIGLRVVRDKRIENIESHAILADENLRESKSLTLDTISYPLKIVDPYRGQEDLKNKIIRAVGDANERFSEDALRMMRAVRFATLLDFEIEEQTLEAIKKNVKNLLRVSKERVREELFKVVASENVDVGMRLFRETGLLTVFLPELDVCFSVEQKSPKRHHIYDVGTHCVMSAKFCPSKNVIVKFATMLHDIGKAKVANVTNEGVRTFYNHEVVGSRIVNKICDRFHLSRNQKEKMFLLVRWHQFSVGEDQTDSAVRRFIKNVGIENVEDMMDLRVGDRLGGGLQQPESWRLKLFRQRIKDVLKQPFTVKDLKIDGNDVMRELDLKPGPRVGQILNKLFEEVASDKEKNSKDYLISRLAQFKPS